MYMFRTVPLSIIRNFSLYTQEWYICHTACEQDQDGTAVPSWSCSQGDSKPVWHIPLLCVQWKTPDNGQRNCPKHVEFDSKNKFEKLVNIVGFIIIIYDDAPSPELQKSYVAYGVEIKGCVFLTLTQLVCYLVSRPGQLFFWYRHVLWMDRRVLRRARCAARNTILVQYLCHEIGVQDNSTHSWIRLGYVCALRLDHLFLRARVPVNSLNWLLCGPQIRCGYLLRWKKKSLALEGMESRTFRF